MGLVIPISSVYDPKGVQKAQADIKRAEGGFGKASAGIQAAFKPALGVFGAAAGAAVLMANKAGDLNEALSATRQVFGDASGAVEDFAASAATSLGQSNTQALQALQTFGTFGKSAGLAGDDLAGFATQMDTLAGDLASFKNTSPEEAITAIGAALRGESEPIRKYGVLLDDATLRQEAMALGITKTTDKALTPQQKVLAAQSAILKQTGDAQGDFAKTSEGAANQQRIMTAQMEDAQAAIGQGFLPVLTVLLSTFAKLAGWIKENSTLFTIIITVIGAFAAVIIGLNVALGIYNTISSIMAINTARAAAGQWALNAAMFANPVFLIVVGVVALIAAIVLLWKKNEAFRNFVTGAWQKILGAFKAVWTWVKTNWPLLLVILTGPIGLAVLAIAKNWDKVKGGVKAVIDWVKTNFGKVKGYLTAPFEAWWTVLSGIFDKVMGAIQKVLDFIGKIKVPHLPDLNPFSSSAGASATAVPVVTPGAAAGRTVAARTAAAIRTASGGGTTVNVYGAIDPEGTARQINRILAGHDQRQGRPQGTVRAVAW